jgi:hypothetical protein
VERSSGKALLIEIDYVPLHSQNKFHASTARFKGFSGPIGSGKSQALCQEAIRLSYLNPGRQGLIGAPTYPACRFEVLYPPDVNNFALTQVINYPTGDWTPANLNCLKTESFSFTYDRDLDLSLVSMNAVNRLGFTPSERSHLVGISDPSTAWLKEVRLAQGLGFESVVLFALDQMCLVGYSLPLSTGFRRSTRLG